MANKGDFKAARVRMDAYARQVKRLYDDAIAELINIARESDFLMEEGMFSFEANQLLKKRMEKAMRRLNGAVETAIRNDIELEWDKANKEWDNVVYKNFNPLKGKKSPIYAAMMAHNTDALSRFVNRMSEGMNLSDRVWKIGDQFRKEMELALSVSIGEGESAGTISRRVREYLSNPDKLFRRVRDEEGNLKLSKAAKEYHPGQGVYRSSYKNAMRLARTETNMAYRKADTARRVNLDFVVGIKINLSKVHEHEDEKMNDICDELQGNYPKDFDFTGWHPQCMCYSTAILLSREEMDDYLKAMLRGEEYEINGKINDVPKAFKDWVIDNKDRIEDAAESGKMPYFLKDNEKYWKK